jgi:hypothetical protein
MESFTLAIVVGRVVLYLLSSTIGLLLNLIVLPSVEAADILGPKKLVVLRVYFKDYANTSRYSKVQVESLVANLDTLWRNTSYHKISIDAQVSDLYQLPDNRSLYVDDFSDGDLSNGGKYMRSSTTPLPTHRRALTGRILMPSQC